jgi:hypothetical protein
MALVDGFQRERSRSLLVQEDLPRRGHVDHGCHQSNRSWNHTPPRQISSPDRRPGRSTAAVGGPSRPCPSCGFSRASAGQLDFRTTFAVRSTWASLPRSDTVCERRRQREFGTRDHRPTDVQHPTLHHRSADGQRGKFQHPEFVKYLRKYSPQHLHNTCLGLGITDFRQHNQYILDQVVLDSGRTLFLGSSINRQQVDTHDDQYVRDDDSGLSDAR